MSTAVKLAARRQHHSCDGRQCCQPPSTPGVTLAGFSCQHVGWPAFPDEDVITRQKKAFRRCHLHLLSLQFPLQHSSSPPLQTAPTSCWPGAQPVEARGVAMQGKGAGGGKELWHQQHQCTVLSE